jgi:hypothetical protein
LFSPLLFHQSLLLILEVSLGLRGGLLLSQELLVLLRFEHALLLLVLAILTLQLVLPELRDVVGLIRLGGGRRRRLALDLLLGSRG